MSRSPLDLHADPVASADERGGSLEQLVHELAASNAQLSQRYERRLSMESRLRRVATGMHRVLDVDAILSFVVAELVAALGGRAVVYCLDVDGSVTVRAQWFDEATPPVRELEGVSLPEQMQRQAWRLAARDRTATVDNVAGARGIDAAARDHLVGLDVTAMMSGAIQLVDDEVLFIVVHHLDGPRAWTDDDVAVLEGIVRETASALRNAVAFEHQQVALRDRQQLDRDKDAFVSNVSHELRTPLASVLGYLELLRDEHADGLNEQQVGLLEIVERNAGRLLTLIEDLLLLSRVQDRDRPLNHEPVRLDDLVKGIVATVRPAAKERRLEVSTDLPEEHGMTVLGDAVELERAVLNLVTNAVKFTPPGGQVAIEVAYQAEQVRLQVTDDGVGIPEKEQSRLFERFYRGSAAQSGAVTGSGLGLSITHHIVQRHGGTIRLSSTPGEGTTFTIELPRSAHQPASS